MAPSSYSEGPHLPKWLQMVIALATAAALVWVFNTVLAGG